MKILSRNCFILFATFFFLFSLATSLEAAANISQTPNVASWAPRIAVDSAGNLHVVWAEYYTPPQHTLPNPGTGDAFYSKYDVSTQTWSTPLNLSNSARVNSSEYRPVGIDIDSSNTIYVVYIDNNLTIKLRTFSTGAGWSSPFDISSHSNDEIDCARIAVDPGGNIYTCWWGIWSGVVYSRARVGGTWESVRTLSVGRRSKFPDIAVGSNEVWATFVQRDPAEYYTYYLRRSKSLNASWSSPQIVYQSPPENGHEFPAIEIDSNETPHLIWMLRVDPDSYDRWTVYSQWTGAGWTSPQVISSQALLHYPSLHKRGNNLYAIYQYGSWGNGVAALYNTRISGAWTGQTTVPDSVGVTYVDVSTSPSQDKIYFVWDAGGEIWCNMGATGPPPPPPPGYPVANFSFSPTSGNAPLTVTFDASASYDPDGTIVSYAWSFGTGATGSGRVTSYTYTTAGTFTIRLTVTDNDGKTGSTTKTITVLQFNYPPNAEFSFSPTTGIFPLQVTFDASASTDPDGSIVLYSWEFGDGATGSGRVVTHTYQRWGTFSIKLTVRDDRNATASKIRTIEVLRLFQPLNIRWQTHVDQSLFQTRYVTEVKWDKNPQNDQLGAQFGVQIVRYRIWRKKTADLYASYIPIAEVAADIYRHLDTKAGGKDLHTYTVTAIDNQGRESPIIDASFSRQTEVQEQKNPGKLRGLVKKTTS
ncbi:MAG: PKD domain-containing protein [Clostridiales bacterium]|nr:PKD domain-containing protein [Clostridiales bacterium]